MPETCPKCGANHLRRKTGQKSHQKGTPPYVEHFIDYWQCGSWRFEGEEIGQSSLCRIAELTRDLAAAREEFAALKQMRMTEAMDWASQLASRDSLLSEAVGLLRRLVERECPIGFVVDAVAFLGRLGQQEEHVPNPEVAIPLLANAASGELDRILDDAEARIAAKSPQPLDIDENYACEAACQRGGSHGLCKTHPTCEMVRQQLAAAQEQNRRLAEENERTAVEKSDLMGANHRQIKVIGRLREMLLMSYQPADSEDGATFRWTTDADIDAALAKE